MKRLIEVEEAKKLLETIKLPVEKREVFVLDAVNKFSAEDVFAPIDLPPFNRSTRDGYAVLSEDVVNASETSPVKLKIVESIEAGEFKRVRISSGECAKIATGAIIPENGDAVVMVENCEEKEGYVFVKKAVAPKENVMLKGSDVAEGELVVREGEKLTPEKIGLLSGLGLRKIKIYDLKVAVFSTGNEIILPGEKLEHGKIFDVNGFAIVTSLRNLGFSAEFLGILKDDVEEMKKKLAEASKEYDVVITSGATSAGERDLLVEAVKDVGEIVFHGVRIKPGKPFLVAKISDSILFGLPGFPVSALTILHEFVKPVLLKSVKARVENQIVEGVVAKRIYSEGRRELLPVVVAGKRIFPLEKGSGAITSLTNASGYLEIAENEEVIERGEKRKVRIFSKTYDFVVAGVDLLKLLDLNSFYLTSDQKLAKVEFALGNIDAVVTLGEKYEVDVIFAGKDGKIGSVEGYELKSEIEFRDHFQMYHALRRGKIDGALFLKPFAEKLGVRGEKVSSVRLDVISRDKKLEEEILRLLSFQKD